MRIGVLTGGGDCPGLNAVIRAIVRKGVAEYGHEFQGYRDGWRGPLERDSRPLGVPEVRGILPRGGTILGSSRTNPFKEDGGAERIAESLKADGVDGLIAIGGEDTLGAASQLHDRGVNVVGVPKTIDNDLSATDYTFGFVRLGGIANWLEGEIERRTGHEARATVLGHVQRGGTPTAFDRVLATRFGLHAIDAAHEGRWGQMTSLRGTDISLVELSEAVAEP